MRVERLEYQFHQAGYRDFPDRIAIINGASGGMLGAGYYVLDLRNRWKANPALREFMDGDSLRHEQLQRILQAARADRPPPRHLRFRNPTDPLTPAENSPCWRLTGDCLTPLTQQYALADIPGVFAPWHARTDRGQTLEETWKKQYDGLLDPTFADLTRWEGAGLIPRLVFAPMMIEDGRRLLISNLPLEYIISNNANVLDSQADSDFRGSRNLSIEGIELFQLMPEMRQKLRVSTAIRMSESFPYFTPAVSIPTWPRRRCVDAGYYDNYGVSLCSSFLFTRQMQNVISTSKKKVMVIQIRAFDSEETRTLTRVAPYGSTFLSRWSEQLTSPIEGLYNARVSSSSFRNDGQLELLSSLMNREFDRDVVDDGSPHLRRKGVSRQQDLPMVRRDFIIVNLECPGEGSLNWYLTDDHRKFIYQQANGCNPKFEARVGLMLQWWKNAVSKGP